MGCCGRGRVVQTRLEGNLVKCQACNADLYEDIKNVVFERLGKLHLDLKNKNFAMSIVLRCKSCKKENKYKIMLDDMKLKEITGIH